MLSSSPILLTSLIGDALALGPHWIYDQKEIAAMPRPSGGYAAPMSSYHPGKQAGDFTHYGDQTMVLLRSIAGLGRFDAGAFAAAWRAFWEDPATISYRDGATRAALANLQQGLPPDEAASPSHDIAGAARIAPLFLLSWETPEELFTVARAQTAFTHNDPAVIETAEFFARVTLAVQSGSAIAEALRATAALAHWQALPAAWFAAAEASQVSAASDSAAALAHGLACSASQAFPTLCHLLLRHPEDAAAALSANAAAGGDSAARGLIMGMVYGALPHAAPLPAAWLTGLRAHAEIQRCLAALEMKPKPGASGGLP
jgi:ADP-ribosylglycohydrolase